MHIYMYVLKKREEWGNCLLSRGENLLQQYIAYNDYQQSDLVQATSSRERND